MNIKLMDIKRQHDSHALEYENAAISVLRSGNYIGGEEVARFEKEFAEYEGAKYGIACGNGTDAIVLALKSLGIGPGDEVITVAFTFFATSESIANVGATPVFVDVCRDTYCIDASLIENKITKNTKAILPVNFYGQACEMDKLKSICKKHSLYLIMDCAQSAGTEYKGFKVSTLGDVSCFSFFPTKNLGGCGDGGMILTNDESIATACRTLRAHGSGEDGLNHFLSVCEEKRITIPDESLLGKTKYYNYFVGYNSRLDTIQAAILRIKLKYLNDFICKRRKNADFYNRALKNTSYTTPFVPQYSNHSYYIYALKHPNAKRIVELLNKNGIQSGVYYPVPLHLQLAFSKLGYKKGDLPITEELCQTTFAIPVFPELSEEEKEYIVKVLIEIENAK